MSTVFVYSIAPSVLATSEHIALCASWLSEEELARRARYRFAKDQQNSLVARALTRAALSFHDARRAPWEWTFQANRFGRPDVEQRSEEVPLRFNVSHTEGMVVCAIERGTALELGVDVEPLDRKASFSEIADRYFAPSEVSALRSLPEHAHRRRFLSYWTLKEAYIKARGMGLAIPLEQFAFELDAGPRITIRFDPKLGDREDEWTFEQFEQDAEQRGYLLAVGFRSGKHAAYAVEKKSGATLLLQMMEQFGAKPNQGVGGKTEASSSNV